MNCASVKAWMRERFDQGLALETGFESHLADCADCRAYHERLRGLESALARLTAEEPSPGFIEAVAARVRRSPESDTWWRMAPVLVVAMAFSAVVGWQLPGELSWSRWFDALLAWLPQPVALEGFSMSAVALTEGWWAALNAFWSHSSVGGAWLSGASIAGLVLALFLFNALLRRMGDRGLSNFSKGAK